MQNEDMINVEIQPINKIPPAKHLFKKGHSKYEGVFKQLMHLEVGRPVEVKCREAKPLLVYGALWKLLKLRRIKNIRLVCRSNKLFAEKMFE